MRRLQASSAFRWTSWQVSAGLTAGAGARERRFFAACALLFVASVWGTIGWCRSMSGGMPMPGGWTMSMAWMRMPGQTWLDATASFMGMWIVMMVAMMLPSLMSMLTRYRRALRWCDETRLDALTAGVGAAYLLVWATVGAVAYPLGMAVASAAMRWPTLARAVPLASGGVVLFAGCVQVTGWKARQLACCRVEPGPDLRADAGSAWRHGLRLGVHCVLCCCGFILILLVSGVMDIGSMALVAAGITFERLAPVPTRAVRATGEVVLAAGVVLIAHAVGMA